MIAIIKSRPEQQSVSAKRYGPKYPQPPKGFKIPRPIPQVEPIHDGKGGKGQSVWEVLYNAEREKDAHMRHGEHNETDCIAD
ncbi:uncharacterized protein EAE97_011774 [Botrytis byssoidea]|uniref:Uncharacterized protein n=1 Tax=Botrytis byssoidea TaxID=139641 RepID=A0A9P5LGM7_9HELO|nr:uncharacterized protein EAE97_011774 [Botrytis byssoidea]KAF7919058.1 hypothetical protein EAE97_011774 [Botrytis byssoidea]